MICIDTDLLAVEKYTKSSLKKIPEVKITVSLSP